MGEREESVWIGCSGWNYSGLARDRLPEGPARQAAGSSTTPRSSGTVEVNNTFYRLPTASAVAGLGRSVARRLPVHRQGEPLPDSHETADRHGAGVERFYERIEPLIDAQKLGPVLWQLPGNFHRDDERLASALAQLPAAGTASSFAIPSWFVRGRLPAPARARRRARDRRPPRAAVPVARAHGRLDVHSLPLRNSRPWGQLLPGASSRPGSGGSTPGASESRCSPTSTTTGRLMPSRTPCSSRAAWASCQSFGSSLLRASERARTGRRCARPASAGPRGRRRAGRRLLLQG